MIETTIAWLAVYGGACIVLGIGITALAIVGLMLWDYMKHGSPIG